MKDYFAKKRNWYLFALAIILRIAFMGFVTNTGAWEASDTTSYVGPVKEMLAQGTFTVAGIPQVTRTPLYPAFLCICTLISEEYYYIVAEIIQQIIGLLVFFVWRKLLQMFLSDGRILFAGEMLYLFNIYFIFYGCKILTDFLFACLVLVAVYLYILFWRKEQQGYFFLPSIILAFLPLLRPIAVYLPFAIAVGVLFVYCMKREWKKGVYYSIILVAIAGMVIGGWSYRNLKVNGSFEVSDISAANVYLYGAPAVEAELTGRNYYDIQEERSRIWNELGGDINNEMIREQGIDLIKDHLWIYAKLSLRDIALEFLYPGMSDVLSPIEQFYSGISETKKILASDTALSHKVSEMIRYTIGDNVIFLMGTISLILDSLFLLVLMCGLLCSFFVRWSPQWYEKWMMIGILLYFLICSSGPLGVGSFSRFRMSFFYLMILACGIVLEHCKNKKKTKVEERHEYRKDKGHNI